MPFLSLHRPLGSLIALALLLAGLISLFVFAKPWSGLHSQGYQVVHHSLEVIAVVVGGLIFSLSWANQRASGQAAYTWIAGGFFAVVSLDLAHVLTYENPFAVKAGVDAFESIGYWLAARCVLVMVLFYTVWYVSKPGDAKSGSALGVWCLLLGLGGLLGLNLVTYIFPALLPQGPPGRLDLFDLLRWNGWVLTLVLVITLVGLWRRRRAQWLAPLWLALTLVFVILSELSVLTFEYWPTAVLNILGHIFKLLAYLCFYRAIFLEALEEPYQALVAAHARLASVLEAIPDLLFDLDQGGRVLDVHVGETAAMRLNRTEILGQPLPELISANAAVTLRELLVRAEADGYAHAEQVAIDVQNTVRYYDLAVTRRTEPKVGLRFLMLARDVTDQVHDLKVMSQLRVAVEQSPCTVMITDLDSRLVYANQAFTHSSGYSLKEALGSTPKLLHSGKTPSETYRELWREVSAGQAWRGEFINRHKDGSEYLESVLISPVFDEKGTLTSYLAIKENITAQRRDQERIRQLSFFDRLTGLPNRDMLATRFEELAALALRQRTTLAVLCVGLDKFKRVNDTFGQAVGDEVLIEMARRLAVLTRPDQFVARYSGDEFIVVLTMASTQALTRWIERIQDEIRRPYPIGDQQLVTTVSIGVSLLQDDGHTLQELLQRSTTALGHAKALGSERHWFFSADLQERSGRQLQLSNALRTAIAEQQISLVYQPQYRLTDNCLCGVEALLRWQHPQLGWISPAEFVPLAEANGMIVELGAWVLQTAVQQARQWQDLGLPPITMAVNLSLAQFQDGDFLKTLDTVLADSGLESKWLELEITESMAMSDPERFLASLDALHQRGVQLALDDFGTGYSSFSHLKKMWLHRLKIDKSFVDDIATDECSLSIVQAVISMAHSLGLHTIAEGVESSEQVEILRRLGCNEIQGYWYSKPLTPKALEQFMHNPQVAIT